MSIEDKMNKYLKQDKLTKVMSDFESLDESRKSRFVANLIGLGILQKDENGNLQKIKDISTEKVIKKLNRRGKIKKAKKKVKSFFGME